MLVLIGLLYILAIIFDIDLRGSFCAILLILLGVWLLLRPRILPDTPSGQFRFFGDVIRRGAWQVENQEFWAFIGDVKLDLSEVELPEGETVIRSYCFIGDMRVIAPQGLALSISSTAFITETRLFGEKRDGFIGPCEIATPGYEQSSRRLRLETLAFIGGLKVRQP